ncbi:nuclear transport factor 2 family protein [Nocardioides sp. zg-536]|uniref:Nuclear transport factor 2 family protein n=1 Tax=Nocardioides faecalis TaxID=2803858 RepID=A0A939BZV2_9ACTN|nr:nuclear transport factor 2 family protein [Nocardioides faecalis]MBM9461683.1 nuclear transport factor 2 family protein [Nocardioides faecalis]MBS4754612.1 nuclear transport factor 2 family protein [Nocardioides faecalis]QVI59949.1 nuclear transport factor 2 family protein [Nocardioides faecalis]
MVADGFAEARAFLDRFEVGIAARDMTALRTMCTDDVVIFGASRANFGPDEASDYLQRVVDANTIRWHLDRHAVVDASDTHLLVATEGQVESDDGTGPHRFDFRLTLWLVREDGEWKLKHFHGSLPGALTAEPGRSR